MTVSPERPLLPVVDAGARPSPCSTGRAALTCRYRCGDACAHDAPNTSSNETFADVLAAATSRRTLLRTGAVIGAAAATTVAVGGPAAATKGRPGGALHHPQRPGSAPHGLRFEPVPPNTTDAVTIPSGYRQDVVIRWGDPLFKDSPRFDVNRQTGASQRRQFGYNNDFVGLLPLGRDTHLLVVNHEYTDEQIMFPKYVKGSPTRDQVEAALAAHGLSVVAVREQRRSGALEPIVGHPLNRRLHGSTEFRLSGPVAGHELVRTKADPQGRTALGTFNNCSGGLTPWGTWLTAEENINQYFANAATRTDPVEAKRLKRYGVSGTTSERGWEKYEDRFDLAKEPNEVNRFGWIVEVDPYDPTSTPRKRTALGRFKHEAAQPRITRDGRVAVYMGDDERFDYFYKFVSHGKVKRGRSLKARRHNADLLDHGTLYVAKFTGDSPGEIDGTGKLPADGRFDGGGEWIPLVSGDRSHVPGFSAAEVLLFTRLAADTVGATKMDRPEDVEPSPRSGKVYVALTNNSNRGAAGQAPADEANPRNANKNGHVLELTESRNDSAATSFAWNLLLVCGDPDDPSTYFGGYPKKDVSPISCPDNVAFDPHGNLWISTDGNALGSHDGLFGVSVEGRSRGLTKQFLTVPTGAETCGPVVQRDRVLVAVQHPGEKDGASVEQPASQWPDGPGTVPRPAVVAVWRADGRDIGV